jgi:hypothetical protein
MKRGIFLATILTVSLASGTFGRDPLTANGNFLGSGPSFIAEGEAKKKAAEAKRIEEEKQQAAQQAEANYIRARKADAPAMTNRVMKFRLQQATNGVYFYQCKVATNYLNGTDGFPTNKVLAQYWLNQAMMNTNR